MRIIEKSKIKINDKISVLAPCIVTYTHNCVSIKSDVGKFYYAHDGEALFGWELNFINDFRRYIIKNHEKINYNRSYLNMTPKYFMFNEDYLRVGSVNKDVVQIDISSAYPTSARLLGVIDEQIYVRGVNLSKRAFLIAIGSLNRNRRVFSVDVNLRRKRINTDERKQYMVDIWRSIVNKTDDTVQTIFDLLKDYCYFYWCDAIICKKEIAPEVQMLLREFGYESKIDVFKKIEYTKNSALLHSNKRGVEPKQFFYPSRKINDK